ncbi:MAG: DoxX family membrane protein [Rhodospirillaceae bacterium]|nr:DoxX family membrane protein [Rhodospirillaceae bacterium]
MTDATATPPPFSWSMATLRARPGRVIGIGLAVFVRYFMGLFFFAAGINKLRNDWAWTDYLKGVFEARINDLTALASPTAIESLGLLYLQHFALPLYPLCAVVVTAGELYVGIACFLGLTSRWAGWMALFIMVNFAVGGYYDASLLPLMVLALVIALTPSGHWLGLDRRYLARYPGSRWFR